MKQFILMNNETEELFYPYAAGSFDAAVGIANLLGWRVISVHLEPETHVVLVTRPTD